MTTTVSEDIELARGIYERLLSKGWRKNKFNDLEMIQIIIVL